MTTEAFSISAFCEAHGISRGTYYNLKKAGRAPREMHVGNRVLVSKEAAADWRRHMESAVGEVQLEPEAA
jgi:predicted DNA-binding transcriptional regulator AlpA